MSFAVKFERTKFRSHWPMCTTSMTPGGTNDWKQINQACVSSSSCTVMRTCLFEVTNMDHVLSFTPEWYDTGTSKFNVASNAASNAKNSDYQIKNGMHESSGSCVYVSIRCFGTHGCICHILMHSLMDSSTRDKATSILLNFDKDSNHSLQTSCTRLWCSSENAIVPAARVQLFA